MEDQITLDRAKALYSYLKELSSVKTNIILGISEYPWKLYVHELLDDYDNIEISYRDRVEEESTERNPVLVRVHKPEFQKCPVPENKLAIWLMPGWDDCNRDVSVIKERLIDRENNIIVSFDEDEERVRLYEEWIVKRTLWQEKQKKIARTRRIFSSMYQTYIDLRRDAETMELVVADGFLLDAENEAVEHPMVTKRVNMGFNDRENVIYIEDVDVDSELYLMLLQKLNGVDLSFIAKTHEEFRENDFHPMDRNDFQDFLKGFVHKISSSSLYSGNGIPQDWNEKNRFLLYSDPVFIFRKRVDGTASFIQSVIESIDETGWLPLPIGETVSGGRFEIPEKEQEQTVEAQLAAVGGEDADILLSKEANREQLEIAQRINLYNAVLVQGPPGTGKTHTIANLLGHFLSQGQSVLVTSQTPKALQVLKEKVNNNIKPLCVSVLNDTNTDMEKSIDGITQFMSVSTSNELKKDADSLKAERLKVIEELAAVRKKMFSVINTEYNSIVLNGEETSPSKAAGFVSDNEERLSYIPGKVLLYKPLPLDRNELIDLYRSNESLNSFEEKELECGLPSTKDFMFPEEFAKKVETYSGLTEKMQKMSQDTGWDIHYFCSRKMVINIGKGDVTIPVSNLEMLDSVHEYLENCGTMEDWMKNVVIDGCRGGAYAKRWETLIEQLERTSRFGESLVDEQFGRTLDLPDEDTLLGNEQLFVKMADIFGRKGKISRLDFFTNKGLQKAFETVSIDGQHLSSKQDTDMVLHQIEMVRLRKQCGAYWNELLKPAGEPDFYDLNPDEPENIAKEWIDPIRKGLSWHDKLFPRLSDKLDQVGIQVMDFVDRNRSDNPAQKIEKILTSINHVIPKVITALGISCSLCVIQESFSKMKEILRKDRRAISAVCSNLADAIEDMDVGEYSKWYKNLEMLYDKYYLQSTRNALIDRISAVAPDWAEAIRNRKGMHGEPILPADIEDAWKWKQYSGIISDILSRPYEELQTESISLSRRYRELTGQYAEKLAWYHLMKKTENDIDMRQALIGWRTTIRKIGKGTGKSAPKYRAQAKKLMAKCQNAVPAWIMPMNRVIETLDPKKNRFDVVIVDEASQSDVTALGVIYLARKIIIVGDDKQVSPMAIGSDSARMDALESMYIKNIIPNSHLYGANTSLYDIAATTYQPLMLREHFRCVPEIIGFSNMLSYDYKIKPLRDAGSSILVPAVVNYRVDDGVRIGKRNEAEAKTIVALMKACISQPEYDGKTFGVISLLGDEQAKFIYNLLYQYLGPQIMEQRKVLCGNPSHFQGDERDIIFLSMVDSNQGEGPLNKMEYGSGEAYRKRYNVAVSRAKDQLWVVDSLDSSNDLKPGDIRRTLIEYSKDPKAFEQIRKEVESRSESPFEASVVTALTCRGYKLAQQWEVGSYRLDIVAIGGSRHIAIECDGERYHSGETKIREDMERQTILERSGWRFIRIRGSEYYRNPEATIDRVVSELHIMGIEPELQIGINETRKTELQDRIIRAASNIMDNEIMMEASQDPLQSLTESRLMTDDSYR